MSRSLHGAHLAVPRGRVLSLAVLVGVLCTTLPLLASTVVSTAAAANEEYVVNDDTDGQESRRDPVAARLDNGDTLVLWTDNARGHTDIVGRVFSPSGTPRGDAYRINDDNGFHRQERVSISGSATGLLFAVWEDHRQGSRRIYMRRIDATSGMPLGSDQWVDVEFDFADGYSPHVAIAQDGTAVVTWIGRVSGVERTLIQFFDRDGNRVGSNIPPIPDGDTRDPHDLPYVAWLPDGNWMITWSEMDNTGSIDWNIYYTVFDGSGTLTQPVRRANGDVFSATSQTESSLFVRESDVLIAWTDNRNATGDLRGRWLDHSGEPEAPDFLLREVVDSGPECRPYVVAGVDGTYALTWFGGPDTRQRASFKLFAADRSDLTPSLTMDDPSSGVLQRDGVVLPRSDGDWDLWWSDDRTLSHDIYTRTFDVQTETAGPISTIWSVPQSASQLYPDVALFPNGGAVVVWADLQYGALSIAARELDDTGEPMGRSVLVNDVPPGARFDPIDDLDQIPDFTPSVAASAAGFVVTWAINEEGGRLNVYGQLYDRGFDRVGGNFLIAEGQQLTPQWDARPVMYPDGRFAVAFRMAVADAGGDIYVQKYLAGGAPDGNRIAVIDAEFITAPQSSPVAALSPFNALFVAWTDERFGGGDIFGQLFDPNLNKIGTNVAQHGSDAPTDDQTDPACAISGDRTVTVWDDRAISDGRVNGRLEIFPSLRAGGDPSAAREVVTFQANTGMEARGSKYPQVALAPSGEFAVLWWDNASGESRLLAQRFDAEGSKVGTPYDIHGTGLHGARLHASAVATSDFIQYVWSDSRRGRGWDIRSRRVDWSFSGEPSPVGIAGWQTQVEDGRLLLSWRTSLERDFAGFHVWRQLAAERPSSTPVLGAQAVRLTGALLTPSPDAQYHWTDATLPGRGTYEYLLQAIDSDGSHELHGPFRVDWTGSAASHAAPLRVEAWPLPFRDALHLRLATPGSHRLEIVDAAGRRVRELGVLSDGETAFTWDGRDGHGNALPSGVYFVRPMETRGEALRVLRLR